MKVNYSPLLRFVEESEPKGLSWSEMVQLMREKEGVGSNETVSRIKGYFEDRGLLQRDRKTRRYHITEEGKKYIQKSEIVDSILSSNVIDTYFYDWNVKSKFPSAIIQQLIYTQAPQRASPSLCFLKSRESKINGHKEQSLKWSFEWLSDLIDYAVGVGILNKEQASNILTNKDELEKLWNGIFKGVESLIIVEMVKPKLLLESIEQDLFST